MAFVKMKNGKCMTVSPKKGAAIWLMLRGEVKGSDRQREFVKGVEKVYLNREHAPESYLRMHPRPEPQISLPYKD